MEDGGILAQVFQLIYRTHYFWSRYMAIEKFKFDFPDTRLELASSQGQTEDLDKLRSRLEYMLYWGKEMIVNGGTLFIKKIDVDWKSEGETFFNSGWYQTALIFLVLMRCKNCNWWALFWPPQVRYISNESIRNRVFGLLIISKERLESISNCVDIEEKKVYFCGDQFGWDMWDINPTFIGLWTKILNMMKP